MSKESLIRAFERTCKTSAPVPEFNQTWVGEQLPEIRNVLETFPESNTQILADEVGLGKTYVAMGVAASVLESVGNSSASALILVPSTELREKWKREICEPTGFIQYLKKGIRYEVRTLESLDELADCLFSKPNPDSWMDLLKAVDDCSQNRRETNDLEINVDDFKNENTQSTGDTDEEIIEVDESTDADPSDIKALVFYAYCLFRSGLTKEINDELRHWAQRTLRKHPEFTSECRRHISDRDARYLIRMHYQTLVVCEETAKNNFRTRKKKNQKRLSTLQQFVSSSFDKELIPSDNRLRFSYVRYRNYFNEWFGTKRKQARYKTNNKVRFCFQFVRWAKTCKRLVKETKTNLKKNRKPTFENVLSEVQSAHTIYLMTYSALRRHKELDVRYSYKHQKKFSQKTLLKILKEDNPEFQRTWDLGVTRKGKDPQKRILKSFGQYVRFLMGDERFEKEGKESAYFRHRSKHGVPLLLIADEAHYWKGDANGASEFNRWLIDSFQYKLLLTATPIQLGKEEIKNIIRNVAGKDSKEYELIDSLCKNELEKAIRCQDKVKEGLDNLSRGHLEDLLNVSKLPEFKDFFERSEDTKDDFLIRGKIWDYLHTHCNSWQSLTESVREYREALGRLAPKLSQLILRNTKIKNRRYFCGGETPNLTSQQHSHMHEAQGIQSVASLVEFMGMRVESILLKDKTSSIDESNSPTAKLLLGYHSSWEAFNESAVGKTIKEGENNSNLNDSDREYVKTFLKIINEEKLPHAKVQYSVDIAANNFFAGKKTLIFCERIKTVSALKKKIEERIFEGFEKLIHTPEGAVDAGFIRSLEDLWEENTNGEKFGERIRKFFEQHYPRKEVRPGDDSVDIRFEAFIEWLYVESCKESLEGVASKIYLSSKKDLLRQLRSTFIKKAIAEDEEEEANSSVGIVEKIDGDVKREARLRRIDGFNSSAYPCVLVCSSIGQEGIDLHKYCSEIILHDLNWNPAKLEQRIGRLDRKKSLSEKTHNPIHIYMPFLADTYDALRFETIVARAERQELVLGNKQISNISKIKDDEEVESDDEQSNDKLMEKHPVLLGKLLYGYFEMDLTRGTRLKKSRYP